LTNTELFRKFNNPEEVILKLDEIRKIIKLPVLQETFNLFEFNESLPISTCAFGLFAGDYTEHHDKYIAI
jgi:hypothetical protein